MFDVVWNIKLKMNSMVKEIKWHFGLKRQSMRGYWEFISMLPKVIAIYSVAIVVDFTKSIVFVKDILKQRIIFFPLLILLILLSYYLFLIAGKPDSQKFDERYLPHHYYNTAIEIRDQENRLAGSMAQPESFNKNPSLFIEKVPDFYWSLLKATHDPELDFDNNATTFFEALFQNPRYYNGIDVLSPLTESKNLIWRLISDYELIIESNPTLTQSLVSSFMKKYSEEPLNNIEKLKLAKTFYHKLKENNGSDFKRWVASENSLFYSEGKGYGLKDTAEIFFGRELEKLTKPQQAILVAMYEKPYYLDSSIKKQDEVWARLKKRAIEIVNESKITKESYFITSQIEKMKRPNLPYFPDELMEVIGKLTSKNQESIQTLPNRSFELLRGSKEVISEELNNFFKINSITPQTKLVTKVEVNFPIDDNLYFNHYLAKKSEVLNLDKLWISVVNERGEFTRLYQKNLRHQKPPQIGNLAKLFTAILFTDRGDRYYSSYCRGAKTSKCDRYSKWIDARRLFATEEMEPIYDGFSRYTPKGGVGNRIEYRPIYIKKIETLYRNLALFTLENNEPRVDFGLGKLQMTPLEFQVSLHKVIQMLYRPNAKAYDAKLIKSLAYHNMKNSNVEDKKIQLSFDSPLVISKEFKAFFKRDKRITMQTLLKAPIYQQYGSLRWMRNYKNISFKLAQESHLYNEHWLMGAFSRLGKYYSFVIYIGDDHLSKAQAKRKMQSVMELLIISINKANEIRHSYMENVFTRSNTN